MNLYKKEGYVYLAKSSTGHFKIGHSKNPWERIKHFDTIMPVRVEMVHLIWCDDMKRAEKHLHRMLEPYRYIGEWFMLDDRHVFTFRTLSAYVDGELIQKLPPFSVNSYGELPY